MRRLEVGLELDGIHEDGLAGGADEALLSVHDSVLSFLWYKTRDGLLKLQSFPSYHAERFLELFLGSSLGLLAATAASYCPSRAGELHKNNLKTSLHDAMGNSVNEN